MPPSRPRRRQYKVPLEKATVEYPRELSRDDIMLLGEWFETPSYQAFLRYQQLERWSLINDGLIQSRELLDFGSAQGEISRMNKVEHDMESCNATAQAMRKQKEGETEHEKLEESLKDEYPEDTFPISP